jgi:transposase InsO family protein
VSRFRFVDDHRDTSEVKGLCVLVEVSTSGYYAWRSRGPSARAIADGDLLEEIRTIHNDSRCTYGAPRVHGQLRRRAHQVGCKRVARLMRQDGLMGVHKRTWSRGRPDIAPALDRLNRNFTADRPNQRWVADIIEFPSGEGKLHVAGVRDLCHRGLVGRSMSAHPDAELVVDALVMALSRAEPDTDGLVHHSDKGGAYVSGDFCSMAALAGLQVSLGSPGDCWDNTAMETFWSTLKREIAWIGGSIHFDTRDHASLYLFEFIEVFYNRQRHQAALGHRTSAEFAATFKP